MPPYIDILGDRLTVGDSCFVHAEGDPDNSKPFIAKLQRLEPDEEHGGYQCMVTWFYRPEDPGIPGGRKSFHGERELYVSDHQDVIHSETVLGRCVVHSLDDYRALEVVRPQDYYSRFLFSLKTRTFSPETVVVHCSCKQPENPDRPMSQCDACHEWLHPECCGSTAAEIEAAPIWHCPACQIKQAVAGVNGRMASRPPPPAAAPLARDPRLAALQAQLQQLGGVQQLGTPPPLAGPSQPQLSGSLLGQQPQQQPQQQQQLDLAGWLSGPPPPGGFSGLSTFGFS